MNNFRSLLAAQILFGALIATGVVAAQTPTEAATAAVSPTATATPTATPVIGSSAMTPGFVLLLSILATVGLVACWITFWVVVCSQKQEITSILSNPAFFQTVTVMGVIAAAVVLSLCDKVRGELTASILSGIVGYVLGSLKTKQPQQPATQGGTQSGQVTGATGQPQTGPQRTAGAGQGTGTTGQRQTGTQGGTPTDEGAGTTG